MEKMNLTIDGTKVTVEKGTTVLEAARGAGIYIPALCSHPNLPSSRQVKPFQVVYRAKEELKNDLNKDLRRFLERELEIWLEKKEALLIAIKNIEKYLRQV